MTYSRITFGKELKDKIKDKIKVEKIVQWSHTIYLNHIHEIDLDFRDILLTLNTMELGPEFEFTYEELEKIADDLITGKKVKI